jgi:hypothetical protein
MANVFFGQTATSPSPNGVEISSKFPQIRHGKLYLKSSRFSGLFQSQRLYYQQSFTSSPILLSGDIFRIADVFKCEAIRIDAESISALVPWLVVYSEPYNTGAVVDAKYLKQYDDGEHDAETTKVLKQLNPDVRSYCSNGKWNIEFYIIRRDGSLYSHTISGTVNPFVIKAITVRQLYEKGCLIPINWIR